MKGRDNVKYGKEETKKKKRQNCSNTVENHRIFISSYLFPRIFLEYPILWFIPYNILRISSGLFHSLSLYYVILTHSFIFNKKNIIFLYFFTDTNLKLMSEGNEYFIDQNIEYIQQVSPYIRKLNTIISLILGIRIYTKSAPLQLIHSYSYTEFIS